MIIAADPLPFTHYYAEILHTEGFNEFTVTDILKVTPASLAPYQVVILGDMPLNAGQVTTLSNWVQAGGNLIAMHPDPQLAPLLGLTATGAALNNGYLLVEETLTGPGAGIVHEAIQFHGPARRYTLNVSGVPLSERANNIATLYSDDRTLGSSATAATRTQNPAVTLRSVGTKGGHAAAFTYDLARSVVYTRQGNPAWSGEERHGGGKCFLSPHQSCTDDSVCTGAGNRCGGSCVLPPAAPCVDDTMCTGDGNRCLGRDVVHPYDLFFGNAKSDPQPDWLDPNKVAIPQADEQQRLLANLIESMSVDQQPLPRFWYFPRDLKAIVLMTGDDHGGANTVSRFNQHLAVSPSGCSVDNWECVRSTSYTYPGVIRDDAVAASFTSQGFEIGLHVSTGCKNWTSRAELANIYATQLARLRNDPGFWFLPSLPQPSSNRMHCTVWSDYATQPQVELDHGIRLDTTYYRSWPNPMQPGFLTGSGMPMRFADENGSTIDVYQAATEMYDQGALFPPQLLGINTFLDRALGSEGYYGVFTANFHTDYEHWDEPACSGDCFALVVARAQARGVPIVSGRQMLTWLDGRNGSSFQSISWNGQRLTFTITRAAGATGLRAMLPTLSAGQGLSVLTLNGSPIPFTTRTVKGISYAFFDASSGSYQATYQ